MLERCRVGCEFIFGAEVDTVDAGVVVDENERGPPNEFVGGGFDRIGGSAVLGALVLVTESKADLEF